MSSTQKQKARAEEIVDITHDSDHVSDSSDEESDPNDEFDDPNAASPSTSQKKKKKKSKARKAFNALRGKSEIPQELVDRVLDKVKAEGAAGSADANQDNVREALEQLKIMDVVKGKAGLGGINKKDMGEHKFWATQPVPQLGEHRPQLRDGTVPHRMDQVRARRSMTAISNHRGHGRKSARSHTPYRKILNGAR